MSLNRVIIVGRLTKDPDLRVTPNGVPVASFTVAVNRPFTNQQGERDADFINCIVWRKPAENVANFVKKGHLIGVDGRIQTRSYQNQQGNTVWVTEVVAENIQFLEPKRDGSSNGNYNSRQQSDNYSYGSRQQNNDYSENYGPYDHGQIDLSDDVLPF